MRDDIATPVSVGLAIGIAFIVLFSLFFGSAILPMQTNYEKSNELVVEHLPTEYYQPWLEPRYGVPYLWFTDVVMTDSSTPNKVNYDDALWLQRAMDNKGNFAAVDKSIDIGQEIRIGTVIRLDDAEMDAFFDFYKQARTNTPFFQVTFPDGLVKYYDVRFFEVS